MRRDDAISFFTENLPILKGEYGVKYLWLFGSTARDEARPDSDIDVIVEFEVISWKHYIRLYRFIEESLQIPVDLITVDALNQKPRLRNIIERDAIPVIGPELREFHNYTP